MDSLAGCCSVLPDADVLHDTYVCPLTKRYASPEMCRNFSDNKRFSTWRMMWLYLAKAQKELGIVISDEQIGQMAENVANIDYDQAKTFEKSTKHDVMAHLMTYSQCCPLASPIIHLGATSCFITDNADLVLIRDGLDILLPKILDCISVLASFCQEHKDLATLGYTHFQPAQLTTVGKRASLWLADVVKDYLNIKSARQDLRFRGCKGTVGTQASYLALFDGDYRKVKELDLLVTRMAGFAKSFDVTGQTYSRKEDVEIISALASFGCTIHKICTDIRLLSGLKELGEKFNSESQVGSSAMPYKQNPIRCERCCGLSRHLFSILSSVLNTASVQWLERTLDDSSNRRLVIPEAFLLADGIAETFCFIVKGLCVYPQNISNNVKAELHFLIVETVLVSMVRSGADRQECHERLRVIAHSTTRDAHPDERASHFLECLREDPYFLSVSQEFENLWDPSRFTGCASLQVEEFLENVVFDLLAREGYTTKQLNLHVDI